MLKKLGLVLTALLLVGTMAFVSCGGSSSSGNGNGNGNGNGGNGGGGDIGFSGTLEILPNGNDSEGIGAYYQLEWMPTWLFQGAKIEKDMDINLSGKIKFSKEVQSFGFTFVDNSGGADNDTWWILLTDEDDGSFEDIELAANTDKEFDIDLVGLDAAGRAANPTGPSANRLIIWAIVEGEDCPKEHCERTWACGDSQQAGWGNSCGCSTAGSNNNCNECNACTLTMDLTFTNLVIDY